ncbi:hypothetical protein MROS_1994 [Melioribacter roseus P3M-2]|uniref:TonB-dependent receptor n=1 Tax=Melioribacter roseus (strain DSM 23840 / JCM 17771 / VKM B-2668 / P3M-2) TaxID=1191523 RepID=I7A5P8_MELRP|nr:hypothetical protein [Melioribacter roseus]AFN75226.1 hypothetical protein MROS_1994 [Melioribacter roseus P3M-2]
MKRIIFLLLIFSAALMAQEEQKSIELPDFVITGSQSIQIPKAEKVKPELIPIISKDFLLPNYSPELMPLLIESVPVRHIPGISADDYYIGRLNVGLGLYTYPIGELNLSAPFDNYLFGLDIWGKNIKEYTDYAYFNTSGVSLKNDFFVSPNSDFLPGTSVGLGGLYERFSYRYFGAATPDSLSENDLMNFNFSVRNKFIRKFNFDFDFNGRQFRHNNFDLNEKLFSGKAEMSVNFSLFSLGGGASIKRQMTDHTNINFRENFYSFTGFIKLYSLSDLIVTGGITYSSDEDNSSLYPFVALNYKIDEGLSAYAEYKPRVEFIDLYSLYKQNPYLKNNFIGNIFLKNKSAFKAGINYGITDILTAGVWTEYKASDNYYYFLDNEQTGFYNLFTENDVKTYSGGVELILKSQIPGYLNLKAGYYKIKNSAGMIIPFQPEIRFDATYMKEITNNFNIVLSYRFMKGAYTDLTNTDILPDYHNLSFKIEYKMFDNLYFWTDFQNILNKSNFVYPNYREKPFDLIGGATYRW